MRDSRRLDSPSPAQLKDVRYGETRRCGAGGAENANAGRPGNANPAPPEDAGAGETRYPVTKLDGTIDDPMNLRAQKKTPETQVSGVFVFCAGFFDFFVLSRVFALSHPCRQKRAKP